MLTVDKLQPETQVAVAIKVNGIVQGVGFRPYVFRLATELGLDGSVRNRGDAGVEILVSGPPGQVAAFAERLTNELPPLAKIDSMEAAPRSLEDLRQSEQGGGFKIEGSSSEGSGGGTIPPDVGICEECLADLRHPTRYQGYWATSCTNCGPRYTLAETLPYDRERTSMADFPLCPECAREYEDPLNRRFHAQATACPHCGPRLEFRGPEGSVETGIAQASRLGGSRPMTVGSERQHGFFRRAHEGSVEKGVAQPSRLGGSRPMSVGSERQHGFFRRAPEGTVEKGVAQASRLGGSRPMTVGSERQHGFFRRAPEGTVEKGVAQASRLGGLGSATGVSKHPCGVSQHSPEGIGAGDPIECLAHALKAGKIVAIKGIGGSHLACDATSETAVARLRERRHRFFQPFAVMATPSMVPALAKATPEELHLMASPRRPIVVLPVIQGSVLAPSVNPGMHTVGVMLPYTGLHHLLFERIDFPLVMTSANFPGLPMAIENDAILSDLATVADGFLLHDRRIVSRCDDSVVRWSAGAPRFIRRSRGWAPTPIEVDLGPEPILALGAELQNAICLYADGKAYLSQYIGDIANLETLNYLKETIRHLLALTGQRVPKLIACDLHPQFLTSEVARELAADRSGSRIVRVQHHHAHVASVMAEHGLDRAVGIALDGIGYGTDGQIWGGEVLAVERGGCERVGALRPVPMPGGDAATRYPARMAAAFLFAAGLAEEEMLRLAQDLPFRGGEAERCVVLRQLESGVNTPMTSSAGRFLDAVSALLGLCDERTYEGEPAMRLEAAAARGVAQNVEPTIVARETGSGTLRELDGPALFARLCRMWQEGVMAEDLAATAQRTLAHGMARMALCAARDWGIRNVCLSGGCAVNDAIATEVRWAVEGSGLRFWMNSAVPCGDGGIALGQVAVAAARATRESAEIGYTTI